MQNKKEFINKVIKDTGKGIKGYIKSQVKLLIFTFISFSIGLSIIKVPHPILISMVIAILDMLPVLGTGIIMIPWAIINFILGNKYIAVNLGILYATLFILRQIIEPIIVGKEIGIKPLYSFGITILSTLIFGPIGIIFGPLIAIITKSIVDTKKG